MLGGCGTGPRRDTTVPSTTRPGGYYLDDGPGASPPPDISGVPDAVPRVEPINRGTSRPYVVMGKQYTPMTQLAPYSGRGIASWYGRRYHGKPTSSGEPYDMYAMTAAHTTLPIPSYARVTNLRNGRSVVVRINDRGPFVEGRIIDLSYTAAHKLGVLAGGSSMVEVQAIVPDGSGTTITSAPPQLAARDPEPVVTPASPPVPVAADTSGYFLQLGAFGSRDNAENFLARLKAQIGWLADRLHIFARDGLFRVQAGPYGSQGEARSVADRVSETSGIRPMVLTR